MLISKTTYRLFERNVRNRNDTESFMLACEISTIASISTKKKLQYHQIVVVILELFSNSRLSNMGLNSRTERAFNLEYYSVPWIYEQSVDV